MTLPEKHILIIPFLILLFGSSRCNEHVGSGKKAELSSNTFFPDEVKPDSSRPCFKGAYYRKIVSSKDKWLGIEGKVILPAIIFDSGRKNPQKQCQYLDNPSIYMGGNMNGQETDVGLTWEVIKERDGRVSKDRRAYRPFFRRSSYHAESAVWMTAPATPEYYWYPGEEVRMSVKIISPGMVELTIQGAGKEYIDSFESAGYKAGAMGEFKRVNAIDQVGNEGKDVQPTKTKVLGAIWKETNLYRTYKKKVVSVPLSPARYTDMRCPGPRFFEIISTPEGANRGAETINMNGSGF